jgi:peroxiredoxin family protein
MDNSEIERLVERCVQEEVTKRLAGVEEELRALRGVVNQGGGNVPEDRTTMVVFSGEMDPLFGAFTIALGSVAMGMEVSMFFTFWGLNALRVGKKYSGKSVGEKMVAAMMPKGPASVPTSRMNMGGAGPIFFKHLMKQRNIATLPSMIAMAQEMGVRMVACETSMGVMGVTREELLPGIDYGGVATYLEDAAKSKVTLFI